MTDKKELKVGVEKVIVYAPKKETKSVTSTKPILNFQQKIHYAISLCKDVSNLKLVWVTQQVHIMMCNR